MRQGQNSKRSRGRGAGRRNVPPRHQTFDSNGPSVRIRGSAYQVHEKYLALARDAGSAGDRIAAENYLQHAEHYFRIINMDNDGEGRGRGQQNGAGHGARGPDGLDDAEEEAAAGAAPTNRDAGAPEAEAAKANGAGEQPDLPPAETAGAEESAAAPKRRASRGAGRGRSSRGSSRARDTEAGDADTPPAEE